MTTAPLYQQCELTDGDTVTVTWLPTAVAKLETVSLQGRTWKITNRWGIMDRGHVQQNERLHTRTRRHSDI